MSNRPKYHTVPKELKRGRKTLGKLGSARYLASSIANRAMKDRWEKEKKKLKEKEKKKLKEKKLKKLRDKVLLKRKTSKKKSER